MTDSAAILAAIERLERKVDALSHSGPRLLTTEQAAEMAGVTPKTIRVWIAEGLPANRRRRRLLVEAEALRDWMRGQGGRSGPALLSSLADRIG